VNIILPYFILTEIWKASTPAIDLPWREGLRPMMINVWFALKLAALPAGIVAVVAMYVSQGLYIRVLLFASVLLVGECLTAIMIVRSVDRRQLNRFEALAA
jgi:hypothetical protein